jgi:hypothetical protein
MLFHVLNRGVGRRDLFDKTAFSGGTQLGAEDWGVATIGRLGLEESP